MLHIAKDRKTVVYFRRCLVHALAQWSIILLAIRILQHHLGTVDAPRLTPTEQDRIQNNHL